MKVSELIKTLQSMSQDVDVFVVVNFRAEKAVLVFENEKCTDCIISSQTEEELFDGMANKDIPLDSENTGEVTKGMNK